MYSLLENEEEIFNVWIEFTRFYRYELSTSILIKHFHEFLCLRCNVRWNCRIAVKWVSFSVTFVHSNINNFSLPDNCYEKTRKYHYHESFKGCSWIWWSNLILMDLKTVINHNKTMKNFLPSHEQYCTWIMCESRNFPINFIAFGHWFQFILLTRI